MKKLIFQAIVACAALLPIAKVQAATYGGYAPGFTFTLTVKEKITAKTVGFKVTKNVAVPTGIPNYKVGQKVKFTIGAKGQLTTTLLSVPYYPKGSSVNSNAYVIIPKPSTDMKVINMLLIKDSVTKKPASVNYLCGWTKASGTSVTTYSVDYTFE